MSGGVEVGSILGPRINVERMIIDWLVCSVSTRPTNSTLAVDV